VSDRFDDDVPKPGPTEGVRILGAEEAQAALDAGAARPAADPEPEVPRIPPPARRPERTEPADRADGADRLAGADDALEALAIEDDDAASPGARFPENGPTWSAGGAPRPPPPPHPGPPVAPWTEPPTGAVPSIFADDDAEEGEDDLDAWASLSGSQPRFRAEGADWAEADFAEGDLADDGPRVGALSNEAPPDEDVEFAEALEARRARRRRAATVPPGGAGTPRPAPAAAATSGPPGAPARAPRRAAPAPNRRPQPQPGYAEPARLGGGGRDLPTALATAAIIAAIALLCFKLGTFETSLLAAVVVGAAAFEFANGLRERGFRPATLLAGLGSVGLVLAAREYGVAAYPVVFAIVAVFSFLWFLLEVTPGRPTLGIATTLLTFGYVGGLGAFAGLLLGPDPDGVGLILGVVICVIASDVVGFFVGSQFGKTPIAPRVSPHKTVEGTVAGMFASLVFGWLVAGNIHPWDAKSGLALGALVAVGALLGDLSESLLKRDLGIKDFGSLLPGHGGVLDRFDALLFCLPIAYYLAAHLDLL
jgi:phosphatidate cytidylyltransferase